MLMIRLVKRAVILVVYLTGIGIDSSVELSTVSDKLQYGFLILWSFLGTILQFSLKSIDIIIIIIIIDYLCIDPDFRAEKTS